MEKILVNPRVKEVFNSNTPFTRTLSEAILAKMDGRKEAPLPFSYKKKGRDIVGVSKSCKGYTSYKYPHGNGWDWELICSASSDYDFAYAGYDYSMGLMTLVSTHYLTYIEQGRCEGLVELLQKEYLQPFFESLDCEIMETEILREEYMERMADTGCMSDDVEEKLYRFICLAMAYIDFYVYSDSLLPQEYVTEMNKLGSSFYDDEVITDEYLDYFLGLIGYSFNTHTAFRECFPYFLNGYYLSHSNENGSQLYTFMYSSEHMAEYRKLREAYPDSPYISRLDTLVRQLEDYCGIGEDAMGGFVPWGDDEVVVNSVYTENEYICIYAYYDEEECRVSVSEHFSLLSSCFEGLFAEFKQSLEIKAAC